MSDSGETHFFTARGALCGSAQVGRWTVLRSTTSCPACRKLLDGGEPREARARAARLVPIGRIRRGR